MERSFEDLVDLDALGQLDASEQALLRSMAPPGESRAAAESAHALSLLTRALTPVLPPASVKRELLSTVALLERSTPSPTRTVRATEGAWQPLPFPGVSMRELSKDGPDGKVTMLLRMDSGSIFPAHDHHGAEDCFVVEGSVRLGEVSLSAGDFHHADAGTHHGQITSGSGCTLLLVVDRADYLFA